MTDKPSGMQALLRMKSTILGSLIRLFFIVAISIMVIEIAIMLLFDLLPPLPPLMKNIVDGVLLTVLLFPVLYLSLFHPLNEHIAGLTQAERSLGHPGEAAEEIVRARGAISRSPSQLFFIVAVSIMVVEIAVMFLLGQLPPLPPLIVYLADGILLTVLLFPVLYLFLFLPLRAHMAALQQVGESLIRQNEELKEKTRQLLEAQEELVRREKLAVLGQVAGSVGHELRNPLGVMNNAVYFLQTVLSDADETTREYLGIIKDEIATSERIVSDLLDSVRTKPPHPATVGVAELVEQTLRKCAIPSSITVRLDIPAALSPLLADPMQIHQVLRNLICNGVEAMPEGGVLEIRAAEEVTSKTVTISVRDSGIGITPENLDKLFQPLFTTKARGIGLGLVVVKNLTQANGGSVAVESQPGAGSTFAVTLPGGS